MDFDLTEDQRLLKDSIDRLVEANYGDFEKRKAAMKQPKGWNEALWSQMAELGLLGLPFEEAAGGFGGGPVETMLAMEAFGRGLAVEPYLATVVLGGGFLRLGGSEAQKTAMIPKIADGSLTLAFAHVERQARYDLDHVATTARTSGDGWVIEGEKSVVLNGDSADRLIVSARTAGGRAEAEGISLFLVDASAEGVSRRGYPTQDGQRAAEISFASVKVGPDALLGPVDQGAPLIAQVVDIALAAVSAEAVGAMEAAHLLTVEYLKTRKQFGVTLGTFQVLQHRSVDMMIMLEQGRSMAYYAAMMAGEADAAERARAIAGAKVQINRSARFVGQQAIQLHGGIGMTMEYKVGHYFKRLTMIENFFGDTEHHLRKVAAAGGLVAEAA